MSIEIMLPKLGFTMTEGVVTEWFAPDGANVIEGDPLYALEADKTSQEIPAPASGVLQILVPAGEDVPVGTVLGVIS